jgi:hypothetical protein
MGRPSTYTTAYLPYLLVTTTHIFPGKKKVGTAGIRTRDQRNVGTTLSDHGHRGPEDTADSRKPRRALLIHTPQRSLLVTIVAV